MASNINKMTTFRRTFDIGNKVINWFPGHMAKGVKNMQKMLKVVDCIIEVHDARIPFSGRNPNFYNLLTAARPHILVLNKVDLADLQHVKVIRNLLREQNDDNVVFTSPKSNDCPGIKKIIPMVSDLIKSGERYNRTEVAAFNIMIIGIPNVGKSSLINSLRHLHLKKGKATKVGALPGVTRSVLEKIKISEDPLIYLFDTPGILQPTIRNVNVGLKLALCANVQDSVVGIITMADYLLYWMNKHENFNYVKLYNLKSPTDDIYDLLISIATAFSWHKRIRTPVGNWAMHPDIDCAAVNFVTNFQNGKLGKVMLDIDFVIERRNEL